MSSPQSIERARICRALIELVSEQGYAGTSLVQVCDRAGVSKEQFAAHFESKQQCLETVWEEMTSDYMGTVRRAYEAGPGWRDGLRAGAYAAMDWLLGDRVRARFFLLEVLAGGEMVQARRDLMMEAFVDMIDAGRNELEDPQSVSRETAEALAGAIYEGAISGFMEGESWGAARNRVRQLMYVAVLPYCGAAAAAEELTLTPPEPGSKAPASPGVLGKL